jgi:hypothetical protein
VFKLQEQFIKKEFKHGETTWRQDGHSPLFNFAAWAQIAHSFLGSNLKGMTTI